MKEVKRDNDIIKWRNIFFLALMLLSVSLIEGGRQNEVHLNTSNVIMAGMAMAAGQ